MTGARSGLWDFVETLQAAPALADVGDAFTSAVDRLGFLRVGMLSVVDPLNPGPRGVSIVKNQDDWIAHYSEEGYYRIDPIQQAAQRRATPFTWSEPGFRDGMTSVQLTMMQELDDAMLGDGMFIPLRMPGELPAGCALFLGDDDISPESYAIGHSMAVFAHAAACRHLKNTVPAQAAPPKLTARERECLVLAARGKSDWEIGRLLNLSERTIHHAIERAKRRLGVATRVQAVVRAIHLGEISTSETAD